MFKFLQAIIDVLNLFLKPVTVIFLSLTGAVGWLLAAIADPEGFMNMAVCWVIDLISWVFPSTPDSLKIYNIIVSLADKMPLIGYSIIMEILQSIGIIAGIALVVKIYKLIPFKAT